MTVHPVKYLVKPGDIFTCNTSHTSTLGSLIRSCTGERWVHNAIYAGWDTERQEKIVIDSQCTGFHKRSLDEYIHTKDAYLIHRVNQTAGVKAAQNARSRVGMQYGVLRLAHQALNYHFDLDLPKWDWLGDSCSDFVNKAYNHAFGPKGTVQPWDIPRCDKTSLVYAHNTRYIERDIE